MPGAVRDRENLSQEVSPGKYLRENLSRELPTSGKTFPVKVDPGGRSWRRSFPLKEGRYRSRSTQEVIPGQGQGVPSVFPLPSHLFPGIAVTHLILVFTMPLKTTFSAFSLA